jgi:hypothetical protein
LKTFLISIEPEALKMASELPHFEDKKSMFTLVMRPLIKQAVKTA